MAGRIQNLKNRAQGALDDYVASQTTEKQAPTEPPILVFPLSLRDAGDGPEKECIKFTIVDRKELEEKKSIY